MYRDFRYAEIRLRYVEDTRILHWTRDTLRYERDTLRYERDTLRYARISRRRRASCARARARLEARAPVRARGRSRRPLTPRPLRAPVVPSSGRRAGRVHPARRGVTSASSSYLYRIFIVSRSYFDVL